MVSLQAHLAFHCQTRASANHKDMVGAPGGTKLSIVASERQLWARRHS